MTLTIPVETQNLGNLLRDAPFFHPVTYKASLTNFIYVQVLELETKHRNQRGSLISSWWFQAI